MSIADKLKHANPTLRVYRARTGDTPRLPRSTYQPQNSCRLRRGLQSPTAPPVVFSDKGRMCIDGFDFL